MRNNHVFVFRRTQAIGKSAGGGGGKSGGASSGGGGGGGGSSAAGGGGGAAASMHVPRYSYVAEIRSAAENSHRPSSAVWINTVVRKNAAAGGGGGIVGLGGGAGGPPALDVTLPYLRKEVPLVVLFRALGIESDADIVELICQDPNDVELLDMIRPCIEEGIAMSGQAAALDYIGRRGAASVSAAAGGGAALGGGGPNSDSSREHRMRYARDLLQRDLFPHIGTAPQDAVRKAYFLGYAVRRLFDVALGRSEPDDRDHYANKRLDQVRFCARAPRNATTGWPPDGLAVPTAAPQDGQKHASAAAAQHRQGHRRGRRQRPPAKAPDAGAYAGISTKHRRRTRSQGLKYSLATGNWGPNKTPGSKAGVSAVLHRMSFGSTLSHLRRLNSPVGREGKLAKPRQLHNTHWGMICPAETPEGASCGLVKNMALTAHIAQVCVATSRNVPVDVCRAPRRCRCRTCYAPAVCGRWQRCTRWSRRPTA